MRRILLVSIALLVVAGPFAQAQQLPSFGPCERAHELPPGAPVNVELATVTDTEMVVTWLTCNAGSPAPADTTVTYGPIGGPDRVFHRDGRASPFHYARISDLKPGTTYEYRASSNGIPAPPDRLNPGMFTTLTPPPGKELFRFSVLADIHLGETVSGLATSTPTELPPGYRAKKPYPKEMLRAAVASVNKEKVSFTALPADNSSHGELPDLRDAKSILERLDGRYLIARGSHDRPNQFMEAREHCPPDGDCFREVFRPRVEAKADPQHLPEAVMHKKWMFIALDSANLESGFGEISDAQLEWLKTRLEKAKKKKRPAIIFFHHPVAEYSSTLAVPPLVFGVNQQDGQTFLNLIGDYDVRLVINSHTHRNWIAYSPHTGRMPIIEVGPTKEYPAGYTIVRVFEGGLIREWFPIDCDFCNA
ncbi:MAG: metallophosphoesterase family protein, partial [Actinomycetota bacterium]|nr:metallophosphoesterase family protein [Actinomycetota bacterium]